MCEVFLGGFIIVILNFQKLKLGKKLHVAEFFNGNKYEDQAHTTTARMFECLGVLFLDISKSAFSYVLTPFPPLIFILFLLDYYVSFSLETRGWKHGIFYQGRMVKRNDLITVRVFLHI